MFLVPKLLGSIASNNSGKKRTTRVDGIVNLSVTTSTTPPSLSRTMKYFGFLSSSAAIFPGSCVSVAENKSFWQDDPGFSER